MIIGIVANKENHDFANQDPTGPIHVQGEFRWIMFSIIFLETMITVKFYKHSIFVPDDILGSLDKGWMLGWAVFIVSSVSFWVYLKYFKREELRRLKVKQD